MSHRNSSFKLAIMMSFQIIGQREKKKKRQDQKSYNFQERCNNESKSPSDGHWCQLNANRNSQFGLSKKRKYLIHFSCTFNIIGASQVESKVFGYFCVANNGTNTSIHSLFT